MVDLGTLRALPGEELERRFAHDEPFDIPSGLFHGIYLGPVGRFRDRPVAYRLASLVGFRLAPFWVDFTRRTWAFVSPRLRVGRFTPSVAPSRWRTTRVVALDYGVSRLPSPIRGLLYDEVKPLTDDLLLGIGGLNRDRGAGELFYFALTRQSSR